MGLIMKKIAIAGLLAAAVSSQVQADTLGIYAGAYAWQPSISDNTEIGDLDFDFDAEDNATSFYLALEHPIPIIPNARIQRTDVSAENKYSSGGELDLSHTDATLYYEILDNWVHLDLGLTARVFDGELKNGISNVSVDDTVPMVYGNVMIELPLNLYAGVYGNATNLNDYQVYDFTARVGWEAILGLGIEAGYRTFSAKIDDLSQSSSVDSTFKGPFAGLSYHF
jgi:outer membrane protein